MADVAVVVGRAVMASWMQVLSGQGAWVRTGPVGSFTRGQESSRYANLTSARAKLGANRITDKSIFDSTDCERCPCRR